jgi:Arc/MetJ family transcription regulator
MVYMSRTNIDLDDEAVEYVMKTYHLATKRDVVNFALNKLPRKPMTEEQMLAARGSGWEGDLDEIKSGFRPAGE